MAGGYDKTHILEVGRWWLLSKFSQWVYAYINGFKCQISHQSVAHAKLAVNMAIQDWLELERKLPIEDAIMGIQD